MCCISESLPTFSTFKSLPFVATPLQTAPHAFFPVSCRHVPLGFPASDDARAGATGAGVSWEHRNPLALRDSPERGHGSHGSPALNHHQKMNFTLRNIPAWKFNLSHHFPS